MIEDADRDLSIKLQHLQGALEEISTQAKEAYRHFKALDDQQTALADQIRELRRHMITRQGDGQ